MLLSLLWLFVCIWMKISYTFKSKAWEAELYCVFQTLGSVLLQRWRASITKHRKQNTKIRVNRIDPIWIYMFFSAKIPRNIFGNWTLNTLISLNVFQEWWWIHDRKKFASRLRYDWWIETMLRVCITKLSLNEQWEEI